MPSALCKARLKSNHTSLLAEMKALLAGQQALIVVANRFVKSDNYAGRLTTTSNHFDPNTHGPFDHSLNRSALAARWKRLATATPLRQPIAAPTVQKPGMPKKLRAHADHAKIVPLDEEQPGK
jgi:hypothetical protein